MRKIILLAVIAISANSFAQNEAQIAAKKIELTSAQAELAAAQAKIDAINGQIKSLQPIQKWDQGGFQAVNFNQVGLTNWSKGGVNSISITALGNLYANYKHANWSWENNLDLAYGVLKNQGESLRKNEDKIDLMTKVGRRATNQINWAAFARLETQFAEGFDFNAPEENRPIISKFMAPGYLKASAGIDYKPTPQLTFYISPLAGKVTIVSDDSIAAQRLYIPATTENEKFRAEFGALASALYQNKKILPNMGLRSRLELFNNYTDANKPNRKNIDVDWQTMLDIKLGKYLGANVFTHVIYDQDTKIEIDPENKPGVTGSRTQFKEVFGLGFSYKF
jgi:hypothetical protein